MKPEIEKLVNDTRRQTGLEYNVIDFNYTMFREDGMKLILIFDRITLNYVDIDCIENGIVCDPLVLLFDKPLPDFFDTEFKTVEYNEETRELRLNDTIYHLIEEYDVALFVGDFGVELKQALSNIFECLKKKLLD